MAAGKCHRNEVCGVSNLFHLYSTSDMELMDNEV